MTDSNLNVSYPKLSCCNFYDKYIFDSSKLSPADQKTVRCWRLVFGFSTLGIGFAAVGAAHFVRFCARKIVDWTRNINAQNVPNPIKADPLTENLSSPIKANPLTENLPLPQTENQEKTSNNEAENRPKVIKLSQEEQKKQGLQIEYQDKFPSHANPDEFKKNMPKARDKVRNYVYEELLKYQSPTALNSSLGVDPEKLKNSDFMKKTVLHRFPDNKIEGDNLLGSREVLEIPTDVAYNEMYLPIPEPKNEIRIFCAAAPNIGENAGAADFKDYALDGHLDEEKYLDAMEDIFTNILEAQSRAKLTDSVWTPIGMGAFLRRLNQNDASYKFRGKDNKYKRCNDFKKDAELKKKIAERFIKSVKKYPKLNIHICLPAKFDETEFGAPEINNNCNAFLEAANNADGEVKNRMKLWVNHDALMVANRLAGEKIKDGKSKKVGLLNSANRKKLGNLWRTDGALNGSDEGNHRRCPTLALVSDILNDGKKRRRTKDELSKRIDNYGGRVISIPLAT